MAGAVWCAALAGVDPRGARTNRAASADGSAQFRRLAADLSVPEGLARAALLCVILISGLTLRGAPAVPAGSIHGATPVQWSVRMADAEMGRLGDRLDWKEGGRAKWDYTAGLFTLSILKLDEVAPDPRHLAFAERAIGSFITPDGGIHGYNAGEYQLDNINPGKTVLMLYGITKEERYRNAAALLRAQLDTQPRTSEGGFWHKQKYPHQMWLDGLYMAAPFYAEYAMRFNEPAAAFEDVARQFRIVASHTYDPATGLFYHGWDESRGQQWANKDTGTSSNFWGRALGWYGMALVDTLDFLPTNHPARAELTATLRTLCAGIAKYQDSRSGLWFQVVDQGGRKGNYLEASASSMFVYVLAKGENRNYVETDYAPAILKGYRGIVDRLIREDSPAGISLTHCCSVASLGYGKDGSYDYYLREPVVDNDLKGVGPFILAGVEVQRLLQGSGISRY